MKRLETRRLLLRKLMLSDDREIFFLRSDPTVNQFIKRSSPKNLEEARAFISKIETGYQNGELFYWVICLKEDPNAVGTICLWNFSEDRKKAELGYDLHPDYHGKGIMGEALERVLEFALNDLGCTSVEAYTQKDNVPSIKLLERNSFVMDADQKDEKNPLNCVFILKR